jgi:1,4-dihydroxy-2-naphthoate octaprenyltransferase
VSDDLVFSFSELLLSLLLQAVKIRSVAIIKVTNHNNNSEKEKTKSSDTTTSEKTKSKPVINENKLKELLAKSFNLFSLITGFDLVFSDVVVSDDLVFSFSASDFNGL